MAIVPGKSSESELIARITASDEDLLMPPVDSGKSLTTGEIELLRLWIDDGAEYQQHWAFAPAVRPSLPATQRSDWIRNDVDRFVLSRLESEGLRPSSEASKTTLVRRLYFDLIGLPPNLEQIDAFLADDSSEAYQRLIDHLFSSPHYGERMAIEWLDAARYADSNGYQNDFARSMWPWRDWVIDAFNRNVPFDQFAIEQLAGDLLPEATREQRIATGFNRNHRTVTEGGSIDEEWRVENVVDRVETTSMAFLGLTLGCARCHDHKYDPISQREFYAFYAFFNSINEKGVYLEMRGNVAPLLHLTTPENEKHISDLEQQIAETEARVEYLAESSAKGLSGWLKRLAAKSLDDEPRSLISIPLDGETAARRFGDPERYVPTSKSVLPDWRSGLLGVAPAFLGKQSIEYPNLFLVDRDSKFSGSVWVKSTDGGAVFSQVDSEKDLRGFDLLVLPSGNLAVHLVHRWPSNAIEVMTRQPLPKGSWVHIAIVYDGSSQGAGVAIFVNNVRQEVDVKIDTLSKSISTDQPFQVGIRSNGRRFYGEIKDLRLYDYALTDDDIAKIIENGMARSARLPDGDRSEVETEEALVFYWALAPDKATRRLAKLRHQLQELQNSKTEYISNIQTAMIMEELEIPRDTFVLKRGRYDMPDKIQPVDPGVPSCLPGLPESAPRNRLSLARWIVDPQNPLTARVVVNRLWQRFFGVGLVKTTENFGSQAEPPSHPLLLDWLATELVHSGWDLQHIQRLMVTSATYRQTSNGTPELYSRDPENRFLARGPRFRLPAELIRDNVLAISGLLATRIGGPSVMPYQPEGLWEELAGGAHEEYVQEHEEKLYRRSLYVYRKRTVPHPSMSTFDAPSWEICQVRRSTTNTPLQALALLNDVTYVEAAKILGQRMLHEGGASTSEQITYGFRLATGRKPTKSELHRLQTGYEHYLNAFQNDSQAANELLQHGDSEVDRDLDECELAACTTIASILLNLAETITKN